MSSTPLRSFIKGVCWETITFIITLFAVYMIYGDFLSSLKFSLTLTIIKIFLFFAHERLWKRIRWGKYHVINGKKIFDKEKKKGK
jgi:adenylylsulfate kinase